jgi:peptidoglycan hydrolase CwlO-like protein
MKQTPEQLISKLQSDNKKLVAENKKLKKYIGSLQIQINTILRKFRRAKYQSSDFESNVARLTKQIKDTPSGEF